ncbi:hypothetical protein LSH36_1200g00008 [Paralvinella palmiformis]|uniref:Fibrinogen C-terminal domain-containing protein n=1 Tax=Paralvinella palmiformis TaxID=53620 RepID=A0AAD9IUS1_9ANNE|nr:hypothetical protein LSH36_1200g00008 [Paralvinella palmiformis]
MRRFDGSVNFTREWEDYKNGFGNLTEEFWIGNEIMHKITTEDGRYLLRVELTSYEGDFIYAEYSNFWIGHESDNYRLHLTGYLQNSTAGDSFGKHNNIMFGTPSRDHDNSDYSSSVKYGASWWFSGCHAVFLTGELGETECTHFGKGIT